MKLKPIAKTVLRFADKHLPEILSIAALVGLGGAVVSATKKAPKAVEALEEAREEKAQKMLAEDAHSLDIYQDKAGNPDISQIKLNPWEWFKAEAPVYWDTWAVAIATGACIILSNRIGARRYAALLAALSLNKKQLEEWKEKAKEVLGEKKVEEIEEEVMKDKIMDTPDEFKAQYQVGKLYPCYIDIIDAYFMGNKSTIKDAFIEWNMIGSQEGEMDLENLADILQLSIKDPTYYRSHIWEVSNKGDWVTPLIDPAETPDGVPGFAVRFSRMYNKIVGRHYN